MSRAQKRHHRNRLKKKRRFHWGRDLKDEPEILGKAVDTPAPCSCLCCGNKREAYGKTMQERRIEDVEHEET